MTTTDQDALDPDEEPEKAKDPGGKNYITPDGYRKLQEEQEFLHFKKRPEVVRALADAAAEGDRSENAEYIYRKRQLRDIDRRLRFIGKRLDIAFVVDPRDQPNRNRAFFGATVRVADDDGQEQTFTIVGVDEIEGAVGAISWQSPVGKALLGKSEGDAVPVRLHVGSRELTILSISYPSKKP